MQLKRVISRAYLIIFPENRHGPATLIRISQTCTTVVAQFRKSFARLLKSFLGQEWPQRKLCGKASEEHASKQFGQMKKR